MRRRHARRALPRFLAHVTLPGMVLAVGLVANVRDAQADIKTYFPTGNTYFDLSPTRFPSVVILQDNPRFPGDPTNDVAQQQWMTDRGWLNGWNYHDIRFYYDYANDTMAIGFNFFKNPDGSPINIAGDADGDGDPGRTDPRTLAAGGIDFPDLSGTESITIALDTNLDGIPNVVAGVPANKPGRGIDAFTVAEYKVFTAGSSSIVRQPGIESSYGATLADHKGELAYNPSREHPDFQFTIRNFSKLPGVISEEEVIDPVTGERLVIQYFNYDVRAYAGSLDDVVAGEDLFSGSVRNQIVIPEPSAVLLWSAATAGLAIVYRRRRNKADAVA